MRAGLRLRVDFSVPLRMFRAFRFGA